MILAATGSSGASGGTPGLFVIITLMLIIGVPVFLVILIVKRKKQRKGSTYIKLEEDCVTGIGEIVHEGAGFGGVSFGSGGVRPMIGGTPTKSKLRGFRIPYSKIISVDLLVKESGIVLMTQAADYNCYIDNAQAVQEAIVKRIG